jgi:thiol-disulfide isomerase/thioredoxin
MRGTALALAAGLMIGSVTIGQTTIIPEVRSTIAAGDLAKAEATARRDLAARGSTPEGLEALSWVARGALAARDLARAQRVAVDTQRLVETALKSRRLDAEAHLPIALGASLEVQGQVLAAQGARTDAVLFLTSNLQRYRGTSIHARVQKNINLFSLEGKLAIPLEATEFIGKPIVAAPRLSGQPLLLFFWAHWCPDCKQQGPILARLQADYAARGLRIIAPTQRYGYAAGGVPAGAETERRYIETVHAEHYKFLADVPIPLSDGNFRNYGVSSTPTIVLVDAAGIVRLYHPGTIPEDRLRAAVDKMVGATATR